MRTFVKDQVVKARGREWVVVCPPEGDTDMLVADPCFTDDERSRMQRVDKVNEAKKTVVPHGVYLQRSVLELSEIEG